MANYHLSEQVLSRSKGRSAVACAAYRSGERLYDERYERTHDYTRRDRVVEAFIIAPEGAPEWARMRERLWNEVEAKERRKDSQLAREFNISLPHELTPGQRKELITEYVRKQFVDHGLVADVAIHEAPRGGDQRNHHAHVMLTMREVGPEGFGKKEQQWLSRLEILREAREEWAQTANRHLQRAGHEQRVDHRTLEAQRLEALERGDYEKAISLARAPQPKLGIGQHIEARHEERSFVREDQRKQREPELTEYREARKEAMSLLRIVRVDGLEAVERQIAAQRQAFEEKWKEVERQVQELEDFYSFKFVVPNRETARQTIELSQPREKLDPYGRERVDRAFFEKSQGQVSKEWQEVYQRTMKSVGQEVTEQQQKDRAGVEQWWQEGSERIEEKIAAVREAAEDNQYWYGDLSEKVRKHEDAIRSLGWEKAALDEERTEKLRRIEEQSGLDKIDRLAQARIEKQHPELMERLNALHEIGQRWRVRDEQKEEKRQLALARTDRLVYARLNREVNEEWEAALEKRGPQALKQIEERQRPDREKLAMIHDSIEGCDVALGMIEERQKMRFLGREQRKALAADADRAKADRQGYTNDYQQLSSRLEMERSPEKLMHEAAAILGRDDPELVKRVLAVQEIGKEWRRRDILELQHKRERQRERGPELGFKKELGRSDDGIEKGRGRERKGPELEI